MMQPVERPTTPTQMLPICQVPGCDEARDENAGPREEHEQERMRAGSDGQNNAPELRCENKGTPRKLTARSAVWGRRLSCPVRDRGSANGEQHISAALNDFGTYCVTIA